MASYIQYPKKGNIPYGRGIAPGRGTVFSSTGTPRACSRRCPGIDGLLGGGEFHLVRQGINHVKVVVERDARTMAKAYAGVSVCPYETIPIAPAATSAPPG